MTRPDVIVVGAGVVGCSTAYRLAASGRRVLVVEQRGICSGASGRNGGMTGVGSTMHAGIGQAVYTITRTNLDLIKALPDELETDFELRLPGTLNVATTDAMYAHLRESVVAQQAANLKVALLDADETRKMAPALNPHIRGAEFSSDSGHLWPFKLVHGFANKARQHGAEFRLWTKVERLIRSGDRVIGVRIADEDILADEVVLCTNAYTSEILPELPEGAIVPARGQILVTQPLPPLLSFPFGTNFDKEYGRQTPDGKILCGGYRRLDQDQGLGHYEEAVTPPVLAGIADCLRTLFPELNKVRMVRAWAGIMGFTADGLPMIGKTSWAPGLTIAAGFNGSGFSWAAITGKIIAAMVNGEEPGFDMTYFRPDRFFDPGLTWSNPFTAGENAVSAA